MTIKSIRTGWTGISALAGNPVIGNFESIATVTVGSGGASSIVFSSIPSSYQHLQLRGLFRASIANSDDNNVVAAINSDTTHTNYRIHVLEGDGATATSGVAQLSGFYASFGLAPGDSSTSSTFGVAVVDILDYANTNKNTTVRTLTGDDKNGSGYIRLASSLWMNTAAVNRLDITLRNANNFVLNSQFALYGIR